MYSRGDSSTQLQKIDEKMSINKISRPYILRKLLSSLGDSPGTYPECYINMWNYLWPIVLLKVQRDIRIPVIPSLTNNDQGIIQDYNLYKCYGDKISLPPNKFLYRPFPKGKLATSKAIVRPNFDTMYIISYLDLSKSPQIIRVPKIPDIPDELGGGKRYWSIQFMDAWTNTFVMPGSDHNDNIGNYLVYSSNWRAKNKNYSFITVPKNKVIVSIIIFSLLFLISFLSMIFLKSNNITRYLLFTICMLIIGVISTLMFSPNYQSYEKIYESPTDNVWVIVRLQTNGENDSGNVEKIQLKWRVDSLNNKFDQEIFDKNLENLIDESYYIDDSSSKKNTDNNYSDYVNVANYGISNFTKSSGVKLKSSAEIVWGMDSKEFFTLGAYMISLGNNPVKDEYAEEKLRIMGMWQNDEPFKYNNIPIVIRTVLSVLGFGLLNNSIGSILLKLQLLNWSNGTVNSNGYTAPLDIGTYGTNYSIRAIAAIAGFGANPADEAIYQVGRGERSSLQLLGNLIGNPAMLINLNLLNSKKNYKLVFKGKNCRSSTILPPVRSFWSVTCYDSGGYGVENAAETYSLGSISYPPLYEDEDGYVSIYLSNTAPTTPEKLSNWLPTPKGDENFSITIRFYNPEKEILNSNYMPPVIQFDGTPPKSSKSSKSKLTKPIVIHEQFTDITNSYLDEIEYILDKQMETEI
jgi:hypothetical protein